VKDSISLCLVQPDLRWEDRDGNLSMLEEMVFDVPDGIDLLVLPETFSTGFTMQAERFAEPMDGRSVAWMERLALSRHTHVAGSLIIRENGKIFNRFPWVTPGGVEGHYDKRHLFRMGREDRNFTPGTVREVFMLNGARFLPQVCYDLRFPVFARNRNDYDVILYVANWPAPRQAVWETLLRARAIENQAHVVGVNRVGTDGEGVEHLGGSILVDPAGRVVGMMDDRPGILQVTIDLKQNREFREKFPVWKDADDFTLGPSNRD
jgi:omega-amidase